MFPTHTILNICINVVAVKYVNDIPRSVCNRNQTKQVLQRQPIFLTDSDNDYILEEIESEKK